MRVRSPIGMRVQVLGGFKFVIDGRPLPNEAWTRNAARTLVKLIAITPKHQLHRDQVLDLLWPELEPDSALNSLRKAIHAAREALEPNRSGRAASSYVQMTSGVLAFDELITVDADEFEECATRAILSGGEAEATAALALYQGDLLPDELYADWAAQRRETLIGLHTRLIHRCADSLESRVQYEAAAEMLAPLLATDPTDEITHRRLMRLYVAAGSVHRALRQYQLARDELDRELGVEPDAETQALYDTITHGRSKRPAVVPSSPASLPSLLAREPSGPFFGRETVLGFLKDSANRVMAGQGELVLISGEPGVGKTRLMAQAAREAGKRGLLVLWSGSPGMRQEYGSFVAAISGYLDGLPQESQQRLLREHPDLVLLMPKLSGSREHALLTFPNPAESGRYFALLSRFLHSLAQERPVLLALDDLHATDASSLEILRFILPSLVRHRLMIVGTYRLEDVARGSVLDEIATSAAHGKSTRTIGLMRLGRTDLDQVVQQALPGGTPTRALLRYIFDRSLGNPLFADALIRTLLDEGAITISNGASVLSDPEVEVVPGDIRDIVEKRVEAMDEDARAIARIAAVAGVETSFAVLLQVGATTTRGLLAGLDRLLEARILVERERGYGFFHPLYGEALYAGIPLASRARLHGALARALEELQSEDVEALAYHYARSIETSKAALYLELAGDRARMTYANTTAAAHYREALERLERLGRQEEILAVRAKLGEVRATAGRYEEALSLLEAVARERDPLIDLELYADAYARIGEMYRYCGRLGEGVERLRPVLQHLGDDRFVSPSRGIARLEIAFARLLYGVARYDESLQFSRDALEHARACGDDAIALEAEINELAMFDPARWSKQQEGFRRIIPVAAARGDLQALLRAYFGLAGTHAMEGDLAGQRAALESAIEISRRIGNGNFAMIAMADLGTILLTSGEWAAARNALEEALEFMDFSTGSWFGIAPLRYLGELHMLEGRFAEARELVQQSLELAERLEAPEDLPPAHKLLAELDVLEGNPERAISRLEPMVRNHEGQYGTIEGAYAYRLPIMLARAYLAANRALDDAESLAARAITDARSRNHRYALVDALLTHGMVLARSARMAEAEAALIEGLRHADEIPSPHRRARFLLQLAHVRGVDGEFREAESMVHESLNIFRKLGARPEIDAAERAIAELRQHA